MRRGFTLFEILIALGLSVVLMAMIGYAMSFYAETLRERDRDVERTQVVRSVMRMISADLRGCIHPPEFDASALEQMLASAAAGGGAGGGRGGGQQGEGLAAGDALADDPDSGTDGSATEEATGTSEDQLADLSTGTAVLRRPGLIGNQYEIQIDVSRLPRLEEYMPLLLGNTDGSLQDVPSDIKTVSYYVAPAGVLNDELGFQPGALSQQPGGLARRQLDRQTTKYAVENGDVLRLQQSAQLLAPEITSIEFQYWDGAQWLMQWHSDDFGGLPPAVQVRITLAPPADADPSVAAIPEIFDMIVRLPAAHPLATGEEAL